MTATRRIWRTTRAVRRLAGAEMRAHRGRTLSAIVVVALGAGILTMSLVLAATMRTAVDEGISVAYQGADVIVRADQGAGAQEAGSAGSNGGAGITGSSIRTIQGIDGVERTATMVRSSAAAQAGDVTRGITLESLATDESFVWQHWSEGRAPRAAQEIALTQASLDALKIGLGDRVALGNPTVGRAQFTVVGIVDVRGSLSREGSTYGVVTEGVAERLAGLSTPNVLLIATAPGTDPASVVREINARAPVGFPESTRDLIKADSQVHGAQIDALGGLVTGLAAVSLLVAAVTLGTTTAAATASRRRAIALARCVGANRPHLLLLVVLEVLLPSLVGAVVGVGLGVVVARLALPLVGLVTDLPALRGSTFTVRFDDIWMPLVAAAVLALLAAVVPAFLASQVPPSAALTSAPRPEPRHPHLRAIALAATAALIAALGAWGVLDGPAHGHVWLPAIGAAMVLAGAGLVLTPLLRSTARGLLRRARHPATRLTLTDVVRRPGTASTEAVAIVLAVGMVALSWVALSCIAATTAARLTESDQPDLVVGVPGGAPTVSATVLQDLRAVDGVARVVAVPYGRDVTLEGRGERGRVTLGVGTVAADPEQLSPVLPGGFSIDRLRDDTVYLPTSGFPPFPPGQTVRLRGPDGTVEQLAVQYVDGLQVPSAVSPATLHRVSRDTQVRTAWVSVEPGVDRARLADEISGVATLGGQLPVTGPLVVDVRTGKAFAMARSAATGVLAVAVLVAVIGAAATAALVVDERSREHAVLRAIGLERRGLRRMLVSRIVLVGTVASAVGAVTGSVLGLMIGRSVAQGLGLMVEYRLPALPVVLIAVIAVLLVRAAAAVPLEQASYVPPSRALAGER